MTIPGLTVGTNSTTKSDQSTCRDTKSKPATPNSNDSGNRHNQNKKSRREADGDQPKFDGKAMGMFYLRSPESRTTDVFPRDLAQKVCVDFTCKGRECTREPCSFMHPCNPRDMDRATVEAIARNFATTKKGWLSDYHYRNETTLPADVKAMIGGLQGPT